MEPEVARLVHVAMDVYRDHRPTARGRCGQPGCSGQENGPCLPYEIADLVLAKADVGAQVWVEPDGLLMPGADGPVTDAAEITSAGPVTVYRASGTVEQYPGGTRLTYQPPSPKDADGYLHPQWCAGAPFCHVVEGSMTHASTPVYAAGVAVMLLAVDDEPVAVSLADENEQVAFRADAAETLIAVVRRMSQRAITWD
jgi:hypothetical protein